MTFHIITIFPKIFDSYFNESILSRAQKKKIVKIKIYNLRNFAQDKRKTTDDRPYGGGAGMVLMAEPILRAVEHIKLKVKSLPRAESRGEKLKVVVLSAKGKQFDQKTAYRWSKSYKHLILISGRYEGIDERVIKILSAQGAEEVSIGPYVLTDGDVAAMAAVSAVARLIPNVINWNSLQEESYFNTVVKKEQKSKNIDEVEYPHYTRPEILKWKGKKYRVPNVLLSGNHKKIAAWRAAWRASRFRRASV